MEVVEGKQGKLNEQNLAVVKEIEAELKIAKKKLSSGYINDALSQLQDIHYQIANPKLDRFEQNQILNLTIETQYLIAVCYRLLKRTSDAISTLISLTKLTTNYARAYQELGYNYLDSNKPEQAFDALLKAVSLNPVLISSWTKLHQLINNRPNNDLHDKELNGIRVTRDLIEEKLKALATVPAEVINATDLLFEHKTSQAEELVRRYLQQNPHQPDAMALLAEIGIKNKVYDDAEFILTSGVELYPQHLQLRFQLVGLLMKLGKYSNAIAHIDSDYWPKNNSFKTILKTHKAIALSNLGKTGEALLLFKELDHKDAKEDVLVQWGHALKYEGQFDEAVAKYKQAYKLNPYFGDAYWSLANTKRYVFEAHEIKEMQILVESADVSINDKIHVHFALGKAYEDKSFFGDSFEHYKRGNALKASDLKYSPKSTEDLTSHLINACSLEWSKSIKANDSNASSLDTGTPIFIVGLPRAGSTLVEQILASHSKVEGTSELHNILSLALKLKGKSKLNEAYPQRLVQLTSAERLKLGHHYLSNTQDYRTDKPYFIDKMPNNFLHIGLIKSILPNAKIIDARREPMACCFSGFKQLFGDGQDFSYDLEWIGRYYKNYLKMMDHWNSIFPNQIFTVQHEDLIDNTDKVIESLLEFCGIEYEAQCSRFYENKRTVLTPSSEQVRQPIFKDGMNQWSHYESYLEPLKLALK